MIHYCRKPPWPRRSVLGLTATRFEFPSMCLEGSVISFISPSSGGCPGPVQPICAQGWPRTPFIHSLGLSWGSSYFLAFCHAVFFFVKNITKTGMTLGIEPILKSTSVELEWYMNQMALLSRHRIRKSSPGGQRSVTIPLGHGGSHNNLYLRMSVGVIPEC